MKKQHFIRTSILLLFFFAFANTQAAGTTVVSTSGTCAGNDGGVTISVTPNNYGPYGYFIYGNGVNQGDSDLSGPGVFSGLANGVYQYYVYTDSGYLSGTFTIAPVVSMSITTTQPVCPSGTTGSAVANVTGGAGPYSYLWSNGATTQSLINAAQGVYSVTATDHNGCAAKAADTVQLTSSVQVSLVHTGAVCAGGLAASVSGGVTPYTYVWDNNATTSSITGLTNGTQYTVLVTDAQGCIGTASVVVSNTSLIFDTLNTRIIEPGCGSNGSISLAMASGTAPFSYSWSNGATTPNITGLSQSSYYYVTVTDANGCTGQSYYYLYGNSLTIQSGRNNPGCGSATGSIYIYTSGGTAPYTFTWSNSSSNHTDADSNLTAGNYFFTVSDGAGCTLADSVQLIPQGNFSAQVTVTPIQCPSTTGGSMTVTETGSGVAPYSYLWSNGATTQTLSNLPEGSYFSVTVADANGCETIEYSDSVTSTAPFSIALNATACSNTVTANVTGSSGPYNYLWSTGQTTTAITFVQYGTYYLTVTDAHGCAAYQTFYNYTSGIQLDSFNSVVNPGCAGQGGIKANPLNGVAPYTYLWSNGATTDSIGSLNSGSYQVTVTDANGCTGVGYYYLNQTTIWANINYINPDCGASNGSIVLSPNNGTAPYSYAWSNSGTNTTNTANNLSAGTYAFTLTDASGCTYTNSQLLISQGSYIVSVSSTPTSCDPNTPTGAVNVTVSNGGTAPFVFTWQGYTSNGSYFDTATSSGITGLAYNTYINLQSVVDANGCADSIITFAGSDTAAVTITYAASCYDDITGYAYSDLNGNCIKDAGEPGNPGINIQAYGNGNYYYATTDSNGYYDIQVLPGTYSVTAYTWSGGSCNSSSCVTSYTPTLTGTGSVSSGNNFGFNNGAAFDLVVHTGYLPSSPGSTKEYWVYYYNQGSAPVNNAVLTFVHDPNLSLISTNPAYSSYDAATQTITWNLGTVPVSNWINWSQEVTMEFNVPSNLPLGTLLTSYDSIAPTTGDCNPSNNVQSLSDVVSGSHDPNSKEVSPSGSITPEDTVLNYTIRFQNTGNAPAHKIVIKDTLSPLVNPASLEVGASNFPYTWKLTGNGVITFTFDPINLPDSAQSADSSIGFVNYSVKTRSGNPYGSQIKNTASVYFDLNPAVVTNTTISTLTVSTLGFKNINAGDMSVNVSPNPVHDKSLFSIAGATGEVAFEINDVAGQKIFEKTTTSSEVVFDSGTFAPGIYIYTAHDTKGNTCTGKIVIAH